ncbi:tyrosine-protein phosphatase [Streptomyces sp. 8K308]|uniref:tyrosine-protein phosphatase n=1 Tax=Streptomyces sp. 8K308 TaxID=2530388 RepID=UPI001045A4F1|nr:tyrosine-protein phosphatase [Streptomyces sp. 8K308]TDC19520.1 tyrosine-protein phosphatase [Streptomyces sp. 8K308]
MAQQSAEPVLSGVVNFRDVGGLPTVDGRRVRHGVLFRSGHLAHATAADQAFLGALGLHTVFDFRNSADQDLDGHDVPLPGVRLVNIPLNDPAEGAAFWALVRDGSLAELRAELTGRQAPGLMIASYRQMVLGRTAEHGRVLRELAAGSTPALLHCAAGKDRAGLTVALVLLAVGVERPAIVADYLKSNAPHRRYRLRRPGGRPLPPAEVAEVEGLLAPLFDARAEYLEAAFEQIDASWGGVDEYLAAGLGVTEVDRDLLRERLLTAA